MRAGESLEQTEAQQQDRGLHYYHDDNGSLVIAAWCMRAGLGSKSERAANSTRPAGESLHVHRLPRFRGDAEHLFAEHAARRLAINHETCEPAWDGYDMDYSDAICGLLAADELPV